MGSDKSGYLWQCPMPKFPLLFDIHGHDVLSRGRVGGKLTIFSGVWTSRTWTLMVFGFGMVDEEGKTFGEVRM